MRRPQILVLPGSNRSGSHNARLAGTIVKFLAQSECDVTRISLRDYSLPLYEADLEAEKGLPEAAVQLARLFHEHDGIVLVSPEYNNSITPLMKNTIDWTSRVKSDARGALVPFRGKVLAMASASPGNYGGIRSLGHLRPVLVSLGALVISEQLAVANAGKAFDAMDRLRDSNLNRRLETMCRSLVEKAALLSAR